ncbi:MAG: aspartate aminotransferase family protein [Desulfobacterales bacterium]|nr:aspartate aminotransferase family protein [Desulfobacterales bacterium]MCF8080655.1 aspartate aminotransferase family protein [Desulfobacterales bacterium]
MSSNSSAVFHRQLTRELARAVEASGVWITDADGHRFLDGSGGPLVVNVGHGREEIARAVARQITTCGYVHPTMFTGETVERLASRLADIAPPGIRRFYFMATGSEAVETAIKLARQIHLERGEPQRYRLISRWKSFHGLSLGALAATGRTGFRTPYAPMLPESHHIPAPYCYRCSYGLAYPSCGLRCAEALDELILDLGPATVSAFLAETVSGATIAAVIPPEGYFARVREICDRHGVLLILDEVLCGLGRTGRWFASEHFGVVPDLVTMGKGLAGGSIGLSAVGVQNRWFDAVRAGSGAFVHGGTFSHHQVACAAGNAVLDILEREALVPRVASLGAQLGEMLHQRLGSHPHVGDIRGIGFLWGVEFVADRRSRKPIPRKERIAERIWNHLYAGGVLLYKSMGLAGIDGDAMVVGPPFIIEEENMHRIVEALGAAVDAELGG